MPRPIPRNARSAVASTVRRLPSRRSPGRSLEPHHLWEDLGLRNWGEPGALMTRHFLRLRALNYGAMRWEKLFYRQICTDPSLAQCLSPTCDDCEERALCFAPEEGGGAAGALSACDDA